MNKKNNKELNISFEWHSLLRDIFYNGWTIILSAAIGVLIVYVFQQSLYTPVYTSSATLCVNTKSVSNNVLTGIAQSKEMAQVMSNVLVQPSVKQKACEYAGVTFSGTVSASVIEGTNFISLSVTDSDPQNAFMFLKSILLSYNQVSDTVFNNCVIKILTSPTIPGSSSVRLSNSWRIKAGIILAAMALAVIAFLSLIRDTIKSKNDFIKKVDASLLGCVPHENKSKIKEGGKNKKKGLLIDDSLSISLSFSETYQHIANRIRHIKQQTGDKVFVINSLLENEGKSTVISNIAVSLAHTGYKILLLDLDFKKPAMHKMFKKSHKDNCEVADLLSGRVSPEDFELRGYKKTSIKLAVNTRAHKTDQKFIQTENVKRIVDFYRNKFDFILIDTAPLMFDADVTNIIKACDETILVVRTDTAETAAINEAVRTLTGTGGKLLGCILNDVYPEFSLFGQMGQDEGGYYSGNYYGKYGKYGKYGAYSRYGKSPYGNSEEAVEENDAKLPVESDIPEIDFKAFTNNIGEEK